VRVNNIRTPVRAACPFGRKRLDQVPLHPRLLIADYLTLPERTLAL